VVTPTDARRPWPVADAAMARDAGMGHPKVSSVASREPAERHCRTREVMPPSMITSRQRLTCRPQWSDVSRQRGRLQRAESVDARTATRGGISEVERARRRWMPGQAAGRVSGPPLRPARAPHKPSISRQSPGGRGPDELKPTAPSASMSDGPSRRGGSRWASSPGVTAFCSRR